MPSGPRKRKSMKKKKMGGCSHLLTTIQQGNGERENGSGINSSMPLAAAHFEREELKEGTVTGDFKDDMSSSMNIVAGDDPTITFKSTASSDAAVTVPNLQNKIISLDSGKEPSNGVKIESPEVACVVEEAGKEKLDNVVPCMGEPVDLSKETVYVSEAKEVVETISFLQSGQPQNSEKEDKVETLTPGTPPLDGKEENIEVGNLEESPPFYETEWKSETFGSTQPPLVQKEHGNIVSAQKFKVDVSSLVVDYLASPKEEKIISSRTCVFPEDAANGVKKQDFMPPQEVFRTSWLNCCGLFDIFVGQK